MPLQNYFNVSSTYTFRRSKGSIFACQSHKLYHKLLTCGVFRATSPREASLRYEDAVKNEPPQLVTTLQKMKKFLNVSYETRIACLFRKSQCSSEILLRLR